MDCQRIGLINGISRYYAPFTKGDPLFANDSKYKGLTAKVVLWSNYSVKTILTKPRDNEIPNVKWLVDRKDADYEAQLYAEGLQAVVDKRTGQLVQRWINSRSDQPNHFLDVEAQSLVMAIMAGVFLPVKLDENLLLKTIDPKDQPKPT